MAPPALSADAVLRVWERGLDEHPLDRALTILVAFSGLSRGELAEWSIARRDATLLACRAGLLPGPLAGVAPCPGCACPVEVTLAPGNGAEAPETGMIDVQGRAITFRLPTSRDLVDAAGCSTVEQARALLVARCLGSWDADEAAVEAVEAELGRAGVSSGALPLACPECAASWSVALDLGSFVWQELAVLARRLMGEVDLLARRYGWSEPEILSLSPLRRRFYLELAS